MKISDQIRQAAQDMTEPQQKLYEKMSPSAQRLFNDLAMHPDYMGQASTEAAILELSKTRLIDLHHRGGQQPLVSLTPRGKQMAARLKASGRLHVK